MSVPDERRRLRAVPLRLRSDDRLARDAGRGDTAAFAALYERHHQPLYRYCRSIVHDPDDAADALQTTMTRAFAAIGDRDGGGPVRAWLFRIAHNESVSLLRRRRPVQPLEPDALVGPDAAVDAERRDRLAELVGDLQTLSERQRGALLMREVSGLPHAEIATALGVTLGAAKQSIYEARVALHDLAQGREMACAAVRRALSDGDGRTARGRRLRGHLRACEDCRAFREGLRARRSELALVAPLLPAGVSAAVLKAVIGGGGGAGGGLLAGLLGTGASKAVAVGAATVTAGAGAVVLSRSGPSPREPRGAAPRAQERDRGAPGRRASARPAARPRVADRPVARRPAPRPVAVVWSGDDRRSPRPRATEPERAERVERHEADDRREPPEPVEAVETPEAPEPSGERETEPRVEQEAESAAVEVPEVAEVAEEEEGE